MRELIAVTVGFLIAKQIYHNHEKRHRKAQEHRIKKRLYQFFEAEGLSNSEIKKQVEALVK